MARYIDADELYKKIFPLDVVDKRHYSINAKAIAEAIDKTPTADVVPKAEVDRLRFNLKAVLDERAVDKSEVAREIFEEIERLLSANQSGEFLGYRVAWFDYFDFNLAEDTSKLKKKYTDVEPPKGEKHDPDPA